MRAAAALRAVSCRLRAACVVKESPRGVLTRPSRDCRASGARAAALAARARRRKGSRHGRAAPPAGVGRYRARGLARYNCMLPRLESISRAAPSIARCSLEIDRAPSRSIALPHAPRRWRGVFETPLCLTSVVVATGQLSHCGKGETHGDYKRTESSANETERANPGWLSRRSICLVVLLASHHHLTAGRRRAAGSSLPAPACSRVASSVGRVRALARSLPAAQGGI